MIGADWWEGRAGLKHLFKLTLALTLILLVFSPVGSPSATDIACLEDEATGKLAEAFEAVSEAERLGGNVSHLVAELNEAICLLAEGETYKNKTLIREAVSKIDYVIAVAPEIERESAAAFQTHRFQAMVTIGLLAALALVVWRYGPKLFWDLWIKSKRDWRVKTANR